MLRSKSRLILITAVLAITATAACATSLQDLSKDLSALVNRNNESVVEIRAERELSFGSFKTFEQSAVGSGFVVDRDGYILTTLNVVSGAKGIKVIFSDGTKVDGELIGSDALTNIALVKVDRTNLRPVEFGTSSGLKPGSIVVSINNQSGMQNSVSLGIIAGLDRKVDGGATSLMQISGTIGPGASGGPVFDASGKVVGVTTAMFSPTPSLLPFNMPNIYISPFQSGVSKNLHDLEVELEGLRTFRSDKHPDVQQKIREVNKAKQLQAEASAKAEEFSVKLKQNIESDVMNKLKDLPANWGDMFLETTQTSGSSGFAIPIDAIKPILDELKQRKEIQRAWLGARVSNENGRITLNPEDGSPAAQAGVKDGDILLKADGRSFADVADFTSYVLTKKPGEKMKLLVERDGKQVELTVTLGKRPEMVQAKRPIDSSRVQMFWTRPIDLEDADIKQVAKALSDTYGKTVIVVEPEKITKKVTVHMKSTGLEKALDSICRAMGCQYLKDDDTYVIKPK